MTSMSTSMATYLASPATYLASPSLKLRSPQTAWQLPAVDRHRRQAEKQSGARCCGLLALGLLAPVTPRRLRLAKGVQADVVLLVGPGPCPWGEGGTDTMAAALGFTEAATWDVAIRQLAWKLQQAVPGLDVKIAKVDEKLEAKLLVVVNVDQESYDQTSSNLLVLSNHSTSKLLPRVPSSSSAEAVLARCRDLWSRETAEDAFYALLFAIHFSVKAVPLVEQEPQIDSLEKVWRLCTRCLNEAIEAGMDGEARACLACQSECDVRDQTQMYRCTVSHESAPLAQLVRCFERKGIFDCDAQIPEVPFDPLATFGGKPLDHESAWQIMEGHWKHDSCSWRPVLGQNPAYDYFPCQYNSWYRDPKGNRGWYDPVFKVVTLDGREVWRKRHYRVLLGSQPGSFQLSTEDNGISLREFWRIVDCAEDLRWAVFHYAGAAASVGQSYTGSLLLSRDGRVPKEMPKERVRQAFEKAGVAAFELYAITQDQTYDATAPLTDVRSLKRYRGKP